LPVPPNSLTGLLIGLAASHHFELTIKFESGSTLLTKEAIVASDLATISPPDVFTQEIEAGVFGATRIVRPGIAQTTWMSLGSQRPLSEAARVVARLIREQTSH
jgi:LysR family transcriptional regulator, nitrogen assimilation regulatory protein